MIRPFLLSALLLTAGSFARAQTIQLAAEINPGAAGSGVAMTTVYNGKLFFVAGDNTNGDELRSYSGSGPATLVHNTNPGAANGANRTYGLKMGVLNNKLYFSGNNGSNGYELFSYDGLNAPVQVADLNPVAGSSDPHDMQTIDGRLYFSGFVNGMGSELGVYNGSNLPSIIEIYAGGIGSNPQDFTGLNGKVYFTASSNSAGAELFVYNPVNNAASVAYDVVTGTLSSNASRPVLLGSKIYFHATDAAHGRELYSFDGTTGQRVTELAPGSSDGILQNRMLAYNGKIYFEGSTVSGSSQLYSYDPGSNTTALVYNVYPNGVMDMGEMMVYHDKLYFVASDGVHGKELWVHDGTGTALVADLYPGQPGSGISDLQVYNDVLYMSASDGSSGYELYRFSDGLGTAITAFDERVSLAPNPTAGDAVLKLSRKQAGVFSVVVSDISGRVIWQSVAGQKAAGEHAITLPLQSQPAGSYFYQLRNGEKVMAAGKVQKL